MNKTQENKRTMYESILSLLTVNATKTATVPAFAVSEAAFRSIVARIEAKSQQYNNATAGKVKAKQDAEAKLIAATLAMAAALFAYGRKQKDAEMKAKADISETALRSMRDTELITQSNAILALVNSNLQALADYGVTQAVASEFQAKIASFTAALGSRESSVAERVGARTSLGDLFKQADELLAEELDQLVELLRASEPQFHTEYFAARVVKDLGTRHRAQASGDAPAQPSGTAATQPATTTPVH